MGTSERQLEAVPFRDPGERIIGAGAEGRPIAAPPGESQRNVRSSARPRGLRPRRGMAGIIAEGERDGSAKVPGGRGCLKGARAR
jgi:hypothetical protein